MNKYEYSNMRARLYSLGWEKTCVHNSTIDLILTVITIYFSAFRHFQYSVEASMGVPS